MTTNIKYDKDGFLKDLNEWSPEVASQISENEGIELTEEHWEVIYLLREFYIDYEIAPAMRIFVKAVKERLGDHKGTSLHLLKLFPGSPAKIASKIAGLPKPTNCL